MANKEHLKILKQGVEAWNTWRDKNRQIVPDLYQADLRGEDLRQVNLHKTNLKGAKLKHADLRGSNLMNTFIDEADLSGANLTKAQLSRATISDVDFSGSNLSQANLQHTTFMGGSLSHADLSWASLNSVEFVRTVLSGAVLTKAHLFGALLVGTPLIETNFEEARLGGTIFAGLDLSRTVGLEDAYHHFSSTIGVDTLLRSQGRISDAFLRGAGFPEEFITQMPALIASLEAIQFQSCFISYSHRDEEFAERLHSAMRAENLRVWFAPEEMKGGKKLHEQIYQAIQVHDRLLLVLSKDSMKSEWVMTEIRRAKKVEREENRRKLFPIRLVDFETIQSWECFDADSGKDLAGEMREYYIPDFSNWKDHDSFEREFAKLLGALKATEK